MPIEYGPGQREQIELGLEKLRERERAQVDARMAERRTKVEDERAEVRVENGAGGSVRRGDERGLEREREAEDEDPLRPEVWWGEIHRPGIALTVELVPETCWFSNLRVLMGDSRWRKLSEDVRANAEYICSVCGGRHVRASGTHAHEWWYYDDARHVQKLMAVVCVCAQCHETKHLGWAAHRGRSVRSQEWLERVNGWDQLRSQRYIEAVRAQQAWRGRFEWTLDVSAAARYGVEAEGLRLPSYVIAPSARAILQGRYNIANEDSPPRR